MKERIVSIDVLKVIAVFMVLNSHMEICYGKYDMFATGGAIGDALFFFCSGFTLLLGGAKSFPNYYKKRIARIYPTVLAVALFATIFFSVDAKIINDFILGGGWFVQCIMIYYVLLYLVHRYFLNHFNWLWLATVGVIIISYYTFFLDEWNGSIFMYGNTKYKWFFNFLFMLYGGYAGLHHTQYRYNWKSIPLLLLSVVMWYSFFFLSKINSIVADLQYLSLIPLFGVVHYLFEICNGSFLKRLAMGKYSGQVVFIIGGLCLESYLIQYYLFTDELNWLFPLNIPLIMLFVLVVAYFVNLFAAIISQTFKAEDFDYSKLFLYKR